MTHKHFYLVWNPNSGYTLYRHESVKTAEKEAERLAGQYPGMEFHVLASIGSVTKHKVKWERIDRLNIAWEKPF